MAAFRSLIRGGLAPVGQRIVFGQAARLAPEFSGYEAHWLSSGTAALAVAMLIAAQRRPDVLNPKVLLPAYGCPDLVAAARFAGLEVILVDINGDDPGYDFESLDARYVEDVVAIVAINFLGIRERLRELSIWAEERRLLLVEDCAQWYPETPEVSEAHAVVLSFGRGKPVNLLGGGGLLLRRPLQLAGDLEILQESRAKVAYALRARLFNLLIHRFSYGVVSRLPGTGLGETRFMPLSEVRYMDAVRQSNLGNAADRSLATDRWREVVLNRQLAGISGITLPARKLAERANRLLRYPLLLDSVDTRDIALRALNDQGLGASVMYGRPLPEIADVPESIARQSGFPGAGVFADRLLTLPVHTGVTECDLMQMTAVLEDLV